MKTAAFYGFLLIVCVAAWGYGDQIQSWEHSHAYQVALIVGFVVIGYVSYLTESTTRRLGAQIDGLATRIRALEDRLGVNRDD